MSGELKQFCYQNPCPKCGQREASVTWPVKRYLCYGRGEQVVERMERTCQRCGYTWHEKPLDAEERE